VVAGCRGPAQCAELRLAPPDRPSRRGFGCGHRRARCDGGARGAACARRSRRVGVTRVEDAADLRARLPRAGPGRRPSRPRAAMSTPRSAAGSGCSRSSPTSSPRRAPPGTRSSPRCIRARSTSQRWCARRRSR
jgi:hypothetical protein